MEIDFDSMALGEPDIYMVFYLLRSLYIDRICSKIYISLSAPEVGKSQNFVGKFDE